MKEVRVFHVDAFSDKPFGGNPAGVVPDADVLTENEMQKIAGELNLSETAFILPAANNDADFRIRYFTPAREIDFCGHATVALSWILAAEYGWGSTTEGVRLETNIGIVPVKWTKENNELTSVIMTQVPPKVKELEYTRKELGDILGLPEDAFDLRYPVRLGYTGNWHLLVPIKDKKHIDKAAPLMEKLGDFNRKHQAATTHLFTFNQSKEGYDIYTRDFAPAAGIPEDPVTGSANGALAGYFMLENIMDTSCEEFQIIQGNSLGRPGVLDIFIKQEEGYPVISVGGKAVCTISGLLRIPA